MLSVIHTEISLLKRIATFNSMMKESGHAFYGSQGKLMILQIKKNLSRIKQNAGGFMILQAGVTYQASSRRAIIPPGFCSEQRYSRAVLAKKRSCTGKSSHLSSSAAVLRWSTCSSWLIPTTSMAFLVSMYSLASSTFATS